MGNYIYSYITPRRIHVIHDNELVKIDTIKPVVENIKNEMANEIANEMANEMANENHEEKVIHPYLLEYGTAVGSGNILINNTVYKYTKK